MKRRTFIAALRGAAVWPMVARGQQAATPVIGYLHSASPEPFEAETAAFRHGLSETGYIEGQNLAIEYRWAEGHADRLPALAAGLVRRPVAVLVAAGGTLSALAAKGATSTIPIVFPGVDDPVKMGIVQSFNRPGGNATGVSLFNAVLAAKRLGLLRELMPKATAFALLVNPRNPNTEAQVSDVQEAASASKQKVLVLNASNERDIDVAFVSLVEQRTDALIVGADPLFQSLRNQLIELAARHARPTIYFQREFAVAGGLMSYGIYFPDAYRQAGNYTGRILKGEKVSDLPIMQPTKFELVINLRTAKTLALDVPPSLLARADEVIE